MLHQSMFEEKLQLKSQLKEQINEINAELMYMLRDKNNDNDRSHFEKFFSEKEAMLKISNEDLNLC